jgi:type I restriction enzyme, S subunit
MNAERLLKRYERLADAQDAVDQLRRFILDLAVRGRLVPQDSNDEPASELVNRIAAEKARSLTAGDGAQKGGPDVNYAAFPVVPPTGWVLTRLGMISRRIHYGYTASAVAALEDVRLLRITDIQGGDVDWQSVPGCVIDPSEVDQYKLEKGDVLIARTGGTIGKTFLVRDTPVTAVFASYLIRIQCTRHVFDEYIKLFFETPVYWTQLRQGSRGTGQPNVNSQTLSNLVLPLPPLAEQHRIVGKVDELMALCDGLEAARAARETIRDRLTVATLSRLNSLDPETFRDAARFALGALPAVTARVDQIRQLRQAIVNLAVRGKLVSPHLNDEPASILLKRIAGEIIAYSQENRIRQTQPEPITNEPHPIPRGWQWTRLCTLFKVITDGDHQPPPRADEGVAFLTIGNITTGRIDFAGCRFVPEAYFRSLAAYRTPAKGDILYTVVGATYGRPAVVDTDRAFCVQRHIAILKPVVGLHLRFLVYLLSSPLIYDQASSSTTGTAQPTIALHPLRNFLVPLPPLDEQHRIVAKVDKLMALCDRLEVSLTAADGARRRLLEALLMEALAPDDERELEAAE